MDTAKNQLEELEKHLQTEKKADLFLYKEKMLETPIATRVTNGVTWHPVKIRDEKFGLGGRLILIIERIKDQPANHKFQPGAVASLFKDSGDPFGSKTTVQGVIKSVRENTIELVMDKEDLPDWVEESVLGLDLFFDERTYLEMAIALRTVIQAENSRLSELREICYGAKVTTSYQTHFHEEPGLNEIQNEAMKKALEAEDIAVIHGPPGTGKTTTLIATILRVLKKEKQVLVCAPSNAAVDLLTEKLGAAGIRALRIGHPARVSEEIFPHTLDGSMENHLAFQEMRQMRKEAETLRKEALKFKRNYDHNARTLRKQKLRESNHLRKQARMLERFMLKDLTDQAQVITCTLVGANSDILSNKTFQTLFIDEAAQAMEAACWIPIIKANKVIFAGDHFQLPPTIKSKGPSKKALEDTLFAKTIRNHSRQTTMLTRQYRMHQQIMQFSSEEFYQGMLVADETVRNHLLDGLSEELTSPVTFVDTAGCGYEEVYSQETRSRSNPEEATLLFNHLTQLSDAADQEAEPPSIGIISPYKDQVLQLEKLFRKQFRNQTWKKKLSVNSIDAFQGQERDIIYISLVRSNNEGEIGFLADIRRMNVAMTRARKKLVMIGDSATLCNHPFYARFLDYVERINAYRSAWEWVGL